MKKIVFYILIIASLVLSMISCNSSGDVEDDGNEVIEDDPNNLEEEKGSDSNGESETAPETEGEQESDDDAEDDAEQSYIYSKNSKKYHLPTCRFVGLMNEESKVVFKGTVEELNDRGYLPCKTCRPDPDYDYESKDGTGAEDGFIDVDSGYTYALNPSSMKFHYSGCSVLKNTYDDNKVYSNQSRSQIVMDGYEPCGICNP